MARPIRVEFENAVYHIVARGNERKEIFRSDKDRQIFLQVLEQMVEQFGIVLHCYCLMPNHYHLVVQIPRANLSRALGWLQTTYTVRHNWRHKRSGHLFQGRYKAHLVEADEYARQLIPYVHLNPVRPRDKRKIISSEREKELQQYPWSSHRVYAGFQKKPSWLSLEWQSYWGRSVREARRQYRKDIKEMFGKTPVLLWEQIKGGLVLGGEKLWEKVKDIIQSKTGTDEIRWKERQGHQENQKKIEELIPRENDKRVKMWIKVRLGGEQRQRVAKEFGYRDSSGVTQVIKRLEQAMIGDRRLRRRIEGLRMEMSNVKS